MCLPNLKLIPCQYYKLSVRNHEKLCRKTFLCLICRKKDRECKQNRNLNGLIGLKLSEFVFNVPTPVKDVYLQTNQRRALRPNNSISSSSPHNNRPGRWRKPYRRRPLRPQQRRRRPEQTCLRRRRCSDSWRPADNCPCTRTAVATD